MEELIEYFNKEYDNIIISNDEDSLYMSNLIVKHLSTRVFYDFYGKKHSKLDNLKHTVKAQMLVRGTLIRFDNTSNKHLFGIDVPKDILYRSELLILIEKNKLSCPRDCKNLEEIRDFDLNPYLISEKIRKIKNRLIIK